MVGASRFELETSCAQVLIVDCDQVLPGALECPIDKGFRAPGVHPVALPRTVSHCFIQGWLRHKSRHNNRRRISGCGVGLMLIETDKQTSLEMLPSFRVRKPSVVWEREQITSGKWVPSWKSPKQKKSAKFPAFSPNGNPLPIPTIKEGI
jgi:hypothetical protein